MDKKSRQAWQRAEHSGGDSQQAEAICVAILAVSFVERHEIKLRAPDHEVVGDQYTSNRTQQRAVTSKPVEDVALRIG